MTSCPVVRIKPSHPSQGAFVEINVSDFDAAKGHELFDAPPPAIAPPPPFVPPPAPVDPLAALPLNWKDAPDLAVLRPIVEAVTGRTPDNVTQAVELITQALVARAPK